MICLASRVKEFFVLLCFLVGFSNTVMANVPIYSFGKPCQRPPREHDILLDSSAKKKTFVYRHNGVGLNKNGWCIFAVEDYIPNVGRLPGINRTYFYEATAFGWVVAAQEKLFNLSGFLVFEPNIPFPLLVNTRKSGAHIYPWEYKRWNPESKSLESAQPADERALKRYLGLAVVMYRLQFPLGVDGDRRPEFGAHPGNVVMNLAVSEVRDHLDDWLGEPILQNVNKPFGEFNLQKASDAVLALALDKVNDQLKQYDDAIFSRRKGGPILGALHGPSLDAFTDAGVRNGIAIADELIRRYPQIPGGWWLRAKMAEWALHKGMDKNWLGRDRTHGLMPDPGKAGIAALDKYLELRGWAGRDVLTEELRGPEQSYQHTDKYWDHRRATELRERLRTERIDKEALGKSFSMRPSLTDGLVRASPELRAFKP